MFSTAQEPTSPQPASLVEDLIDIWFSPSAVFARRRDGGAWGPFLISAALLCLLFYAAMGAMQGIFDAELVKAVAKIQADNPSLTGDQVAQMQSTIEGSIRYGGLVAMPVVLLLLGVVTWLVAKVLGGTLSFGGGVMIASFAYLPKALDLLVFIAQSFVFDGAGATARHEYSVGVGRFLDPTMNQGLYNILGRFDLFTIWVTVLLTLGLMHTAKIERSKAIAGGIGIFVIGALPLLMQL
ncbi:MAG TPA: YIP1 family protein [Gemmatimonadaceae bacterium]|nr:YIP1 family protein [Gemmatimonadaceae bacterium]